LLAHAPERLHEEVTADYTPLMSKKQQWQQPGRLALRAEGDDWNAYYALPETMENALLLASIKLTLVTNYPEVKRAFMETMKTAVGLMLADVTGGKGVQWIDERPAPESERKGG
jgi:hypothetical protein